MIFRDRHQAADLLAKQLERYRKDHPLVLGIPRGSVPMAELLADRLDGDLDVVLVHKIGAPDNPEFAIGSVSEFGTIYRSHGLEFYELSTDSLRKLAESEILKLRKRREQYSPIRAPISPSGRTVIIVDDGLATGSTMVAAVRAVRSQSPKRIVVAAPVASSNAVELLREEADDLVVLDMPPDFFSISQFYDEFPQVSDEEVSNALQHTSRRPSKAA